MHATPTVQHVNVVLVVERRLRDATGGQRVAVGGVEEAEAKSGGDWCGHRDGDEGHRDETPAHASPLPHRAAQPKPRREGCQSTRG